MRNGYMVSIENHRVEDGYVSMCDGEQYKILLGNFHPKRCDAQVFIDGKEVGCWRLGPNETVGLERPPNRHKHFTFYRVGTQRAREVGIQTGAFSNGVIRVVFLPEKVASPIYLEEFYLSIPSGPHMNFAAQSMSMTRMQREEGGTGLSGRSKQDYHLAKDLVTDKTKSVSLSIRLVCSRGDESSGDEIEALVSKPSGVVIPPPPPVKPKYRSYDGKYDYMSVWAENQKRGEEIEGQEGESFQGFPIF